VQDRGGEEAEVRDRARDVEEARQRERLATVARLELGELVEVLLDRVGELEQQSRTLGRGSFRPRAECGCRRANRRVDVALVAVGDLGDDLFGRRIDVVEIVAALRGDEGAADEVT